MAVGRELWWSVWWPWLLVWIVTVLALVAAVAVAVLAWRAARKSVLSPTPGPPVYVDGEMVSSIIALIGIPRFPANVTSRATLTQDGKIAIPGLGDGALTSTREETRVSEEVFQPVDLVGDLVKGLENRDDVLYVDLNERTVLRNTALERLLASWGTATGPLRLRRVTRYVWLEGVCRMTSQSNGTTVFLAPVGDPDEDGPQVRLECGDRWLLGDSVPGGTFNVHCLGKVQSWQEDTRELVILPIAMFQ
ncbi:MULTISPECIES: hypothetical protein [Saccharothrix]|uniref:hypothetical protein n=1 Tax=Saccharothrix TaxID=2071 RepID=UPI00093BF3A2|nr:hypothetical protein [Saccharothrix sp. CB00851]OKI20856.1 hypothetical protein A6A25_37540 [Saccharothrix sp. CB00851]